MSYNTINERDIVLVQLPQTEKDDDIEYAREIGEGIMALLTSTDGRRAGVQQLMLDFVEVRLTRSRNSSQHASAYVSLVPEQLNRQEELRHFLYNYYLFRGQAVYVEKSNNKKIGRCVSAQWRGKNYMDGLVTLTEQLVNVDVSRKAVEAMKVELNYQLTTVKAELEEKKNTLKTSRGIRKEKRRMGKETNGRRRSGEKNVGETTGRGRNRKMPKERGVRTTTLGNEKNGAGATTTAASFKQAMG